MLTTPDEIYKRFLEDTKEHSMDIQRNDGVFRHIEFRERGRNIESFFLTTFPNHLAITGDISDGLIFSRLYDMFEFFRGKPTGKIDFHYWSEKLTGGRDSVKEYVPSLAMKYIEREVEDFIEYRGLANYKGLADELREDVNRIEVDFGPDELYSQLSSYRFDPFKYDYIGEVFTDIEPDSWYDYNYRFYLNCFAIQAGIQAYDRYFEGSGDLWLHPESLLQAHGITRT